MCARGPSLMKGHRRDQLCAVSQTGESESRAGGLALASILAAWTTSGRLGATNTSLAPAPEGKPARKGVPPELACLAGRARLRLLQPHRFGHCLRHRARAWPPEDAERAALIVYRADQCLRLPEPLPLQLRPPDGAAVSSTRARSPRSAPCSRARPHRPRPASRASPAPGLHARTASISA